ncbi:MAG: acriflavin resistance protein, partial [Gemmatimonadetes bacterium]|nr:acriflavin resistance protein [Gemmatimonadota bacterium]
MILSDVSIKRPVFATMMMVALVVLGIVSYKRLAIDEYPDVTYPIVIAQTTYPGASPEVMMRQVSKPIEEALNTVQGIKEIGSTSLEGISIVRLTFELGVDVAAAQQDVQAKVARIRRSLPPDIDDPIIQHFDPNDSPIMSIALQSKERTLRDLTDLAEQLVSVRIEAIPGVGGVNLVGANRRQIRVEADPDLLRSYNISPGQVTAVLAKENQEVPAGRIEHGETERLVRVTGRIQDPADFAQIPVAVRGATAIKLGDIAKVVDGAEEKRTAAEISGTPAVSLDILKISGSNTVEVAASVRTVLDEMQRVLPPDVAITIIRDDSQRIRESLADVQLSIILGAILTVMIIYLFLNSWRSTVITGLTLPVSIISAFFVMWLFHFTVNTMTLLALSLAIGLLIDDAIVVRENIVRHVQMGKPPYQAALDGTQEIGLAVLATTFSIVAVFMPIGFMGGIIGKFFHEFGVTIVAAVLISMFVSFTLDPMLSSVWHDPEAAAHGQRKDKLTLYDRSIGRVTGWFDRATESLAQAYQDALRWALRHKLATVLASIAIFATSIFMVPLLGTEFVPKADYSETSLNFYTPVGSSLELTEAKARQVEAIIREFPEVRYTVTT